MAARLFEATAGKKLVKSRSAKDNGPTSVGVDDDTATDDDRPGRQSRRKKEILIAPALY